VEISFDKDKHVDWRGLPDNQLIYRDYWLREDVQDRLLALLNYFGLCFSTLDLIEDRNGIWYFLDLNPNGQWLWLDKYSKQGIAEYFIRFLAQDE